MRGLGALLRKDLRLFRSGAGLLSLLLPALLLLALWAGMDDLSARAYLRPFPIAVRDLDNTPMSRSLMGQMERVDLFSQVIRAGEEEDDAALLAQGCAAVVTLPKDFFYTMYTMDNSLVTVTLNEDAPLEASLFRAVFVSVMEIISSDQSSARAVYRFCYGDLTPELEAQMWEETSHVLFTDALSRQALFDTALESAELGSGLSLRLFACVLSVLCLFFPLTVVKGLPEELASGVLPRFVAAGGRKGAFFCSKCLTAALLAAPSLALILPVLGGEDLGMALLLSLLLFLYGFCATLCLAAWAGEPARAQRWGNLLVLLSLVLGGALYPASLLPAPARALGGLTLPHWALKGLELIRAGGGVKALLCGMAPLPALSLGLLLLSLPPFLRPRRAPRRGSGGAGEEGNPLPRRGRPVSLSLYKLSAMSGRGRGLLALLLLCTLCGSMAACALSPGGPQSLRIAAVSPEGDPLAEELLDRLARREGVSLLPAEGEGAGRALLEDGRAEGLLRIGEGYAAALSQGAALPLNYESAVGAASPQAAREIIAGLVSAQRARQRGLLDAEARLGRALTAGERAALLSQMDREEAALAPLYHMTGSQGAPPSLDALFTPPLLGFSVLVVRLTQLTWGAWAGTPDARRVAARLSVLPAGRLLSWGSDLCALFLAGFAAGSCALLPGGFPAPAAWGALMGCSFCTAALALLLCAAGSPGGRMDALAPFVALITSLLGGCFGNLGSLAPPLRSLALCTPQGLALAAAQGEMLPLGILFLAGGLFALLALRLSRHTTA